jgi:hypothetical protein
MKIKILGPYNSGTNLLTNILNNNVITRSNSDEKIEIYQNNHLYLWKHSHNQELIENFLEENNDVIVIFLYKNFLNMINSIQKSPYNLGFRNIYTSPIYFKGKFMGETDHTRNKYENILEYYNNYYKTYMNILSNPKYNKRVCCVNYRELINKQTCFDYLNNIFKTQDINIALKDANKVIDSLGRPAKNNGVQVSNSDEALNSYRNIKKKVFKEIIKKNKQLFLKFDKNILVFFEGITKLNNF